MLATCRPRIVFLPVSYQRRKIESTIYKTIILPVAYMVVKLDTPL